MFYSIVSMVKGTIRGKMSMFVNQNNKEWRPSNVNQAIMSTTPTTSKLVELDLPSLCLISLALQALGSL